jgi:fumarylacetoacetate (FAA) hydrolase
MKLASIRDGSRDGQLAVVSRDLSTAHFATGIASRMQQLLDDWNFLSPQLEDLYATLNDGKARHAFAFDPRLAMAPLPRAYQWADGSAYMSHIERVMHARGAELPPNLRSEPLMYQGGSDDLLGACDDARFASADWGIDLESELGVITGDIEMGTGPDAALDGIRLLVLINDWSLRQLIPPELAKGFGFLQGKPATAFGPVAVTPDELGPAWRGGRVHLNVESMVNGQRLGLVDAGEAMHFHFGELIAHLAKTRRVRAGSIIGSGTVSQGDAERGVGCLIEKRALEMIDSAQANQAREAKTAYLAFGDRVRIDVRGRDGASVFGAIEQRVVAAPAHA